MTEKSRCVLVLEPDDLHGPMVQRQLASLGWPSVLATELDAALGLLEGGLVPVLLLTDERPGRRSGATVHLLARLFAGDLPVLFLSARRARSRRPAPGEPGVLAKPFTVEQLEDYVARTLACTAGERSPELPLVPGRGCRRRPAPAAPCTGRRRVDRRSALGRFGLSR